MSMPLSRTLKPTRHRHGRNDVDSSGPRPELDGVSDEILEELHELGRVRLHPGERVMGYACSTLLDGDAKVLESPLLGGLGGSPIETGALRLHARVRQQALNEVLHPPGAIDGVADELVGFGPELPLITLRQELGEARHLRRAPKVVEAT
jgi:hypothetical protein